MIRLQIPEIKKKSLREIKVVYPFSANICINNKSVIRNGNIQYVYGLVRVKQVLAATKASSGYVVDIPTSKKA